MVASSLSFRIGIYGQEEWSAGNPVGRNPWPPGYEAALREAGAEPVPLAEGLSPRNLRTTLQEIHGLVWAGNSTASGPAARDVEVYRWCHKNRVPVLAVDEGLLVFNVLAGGSIYEDLSRQLPEALQHRHRPEPGIRHAVEVFADTTLARIYGEGEVVVNSLHQRAICTPGRGLRVSARALDGVIEAVESADEARFVLGVQWRPAASSASGLDIQLFRALAAACAECRQGIRKRRRLACTSAA